VRADASAAAAGARTAALPVLLADRQGVVFVATPRGVESLRIPRRYWGMEIGVVPVPVSDEEIHGAELAERGEAGTWPAAVPRTDLLAPALSRLMAGDHAEVSLQPSRDGLRVLLLGAQGEEHPFPVAPKDAVGFLAAVFHHAPRGVCRAGGGRAPRVLLGVRPAPQPSEYRLRLEGLVAGAALTSLADLGMSPALLEILLEGLDRSVGIVLIAGAPSSGRTATLELLAAALAGRGRRGGLIGARGRTLRPPLPWLAESLSDWPFPDSLLATRPDFVVVDPLDARDLPLAARLADSGCLIVAAAPAADAETLARGVARDLEAAAAPAVPVLVLSQMLVRTPCRGCLGWRTLPAAEARRHGFHRRDLEPMERQGGFVVPAGKGCADCAGTGARGLTGVFELASSEGLSGSLPRLREEGWRKVVQGTAHPDDVAALPGARRPLRSLREVMVHAGLNPEALERPEAAAPAAAPSPAATAAHRAAEAAARAPAPPAGPAGAEAAALATLLAQAAAGKRTDPAALGRLAEGLVRRAAGDAPIATLLAPARGFQIAAHSVNTALIAARIARHVGGETDPAAVATLALVHDAGLVRGGIDPAEDRPAVPSEEVVDPDGARLQPAPALRALGLADGGLEDAIREVHALTGSDPQAPRDRARADLRAPIVALAALMDLQLGAPGGRETHDLHDVTSLVMERHGRRFPPVVFRALLKAIPIFPVGCLVELSSGDLARIVSQNDGNPFRPRVEIAGGGGADGSGQGRIVDLARAPFLHIRQRVVGAAMSEARAVNL
jgi:hypothetical protein